MRFSPLLFTFFLLFSPLQATPKIIVGIVGGSGSGKTTLAQNIYKSFPNHCIIISQDCYYRDLPHLPIEERAKTNFDHPDSLEFTLLEEHLLALKEGKSIQLPTYNFQTHMREKETLTVEPADIIVVEGILLLAVPQIRQLFDISFFVDADDDVRLFRRIERDITERARTLESIKKQYFITVKPMYDQFVKPSRQHADVIVPVGGHNSKALAIIRAKLQETLSYGLDRENKPLKTTVSAL